MSSIGRQWENDTAMFEIMEPQTKLRNQSDPYKNVLDGSNIQVVVRKRPMNSKEVENNESDIIEVEPKDDRVTVYEPKIKVDLTKYTQQHDFIFDSVFDEASTNQQIYEKCVRPLLKTIFDNKAKATCFGYGMYRYPVLFSYHFIN